MNLPPAAAAAGVEAEFERAAATPPPARGAWLKLPRRDPAREELLEP
jgi:hypothetical protein